jgi:hypothetical protein
MIEVIKTGLLPDMPAGKQTNFYYLYHASSCLKITPINTVAMYTFDKFSKHTKYTSEVIFTDLFQKRTST